MKILVVDDNRDSIDVIQSVLEDEGMEVISAKDGIEGYRTYLRFQPDLVITDIQMPGENGLELISHIREYDPKVKTIYMSGNLDEYGQLLNDEKTKYPINFLNKPFSREELIGQVSEFIH